MSAPELSVVCRSCGSEVSPYVTECPYCGTRLRKRAPKLERHGDELQPREPRSARRRRKRRERAERASGLAARLAARPYAVLAAVLVPALLVLVSRAGVADPYELGAIVGSVDGEWWRYLAAPWVYPDVSYLFVASVGVVIFGSLVESRIGTIATAVLMVACGALGMFAADGIEGAIGDADRLLAAGGNGVALGLLSAWAVLKAGELRSRPDDDFDLIGAAACAVVLIALPLVEDFANVFAGLAGAVVGGACGFAAAYARRERRPS